MFFFPSGKALYPFKILPCPNFVLLWHTFTSLVCGISRLFYTEKLSWLPPSQSVPHHIFTVCCKLWFQSQVKIARLCILSLRAFARVFARMCLHFQFLDVSLSSPHVLNVPILKLAIWIVRLMFLFCCSWIFAVDYRLWLGNPSTESDRVPWYEEMEIDERDADQWITRTTDQTSSPLAFSH
jgi:hypothetical protein